MKTDSTAELLHYSGPTHSIVGHRLGD